MTSPSPFSKANMAAPKSNVAVEAFPGHKCEETPRAFIHEGVRREVREILEHWDTERHSYFKCQADDGHRYVLRHDLDHMIWELVMRKE